MKNNVGYGERFVRVMGGTAVALWAGNRYLKAAGALAAAEGLAGYCLLYDLMGVDTRDDS